MRHIEIIYPYWYTNQSRHFRVTSSLCFKARLSAEPLIWTRFFILMQAKLIFTTKVWHLASLWKWEVFELDNSLLNRVGENLTSNKLSAVEQFFSSNTKKQCSIWLLFNNYSSSPNGLWVNSGRMGYWLRGHEGVRNIVGLVKSNWIEWFFLWRRSTRGTYII